MGGSSPLTRGKPIQAIVPIIASGLIPAHAGKTGAAWLACAACAAHPRSRGENRVAVYEVTAAGGSSPLTRGKHHDARRENLVFGLIPAHAGKT